MKIMSKGFAKPPAMIDDPAKYPLVFSHDYFKVERVYRMEDRDGNGPIVGPTANIHRLHACMKGHLLPNAGILINRQMYPDVELFQRENYYALLKAGSFGWRSRELYDAFFFDGGEAKCNEAGFFLVEYEPKVFMPMPDGQVLFLKDKGN